MARVRPDSLEKTRKARSVGIRQTLCLPRFDSLTFNASTFCKSLTAILRPLVMNFLIIDVRSFAWLAKLLLP